MMEVLAEVNSLESLKAVCCDGTATNTGWKQGLVPHLERELQRKLGVGGLRSGGGGGEKAWLHLICPGGQEVQETL